MADSMFDSVDVSGVGPADTAFYTAAVPGVLMSLRVSNTYKSTLPISFWIQRGTAKIQVASGVRVKSGEPKDLIEGSKVAIQAGDVIHGSTPLANTFSGALSVYKDQ